MDYKKLNELLGSFYELRRKPKIESERPDMDEGTSGYEVYHVEGDIYVKLTIRVDSYGDNEEILGIEFVSPKTVQVTNFEKL
jgi:hypothetical protein